MDRDLSTPSPPAPSMEVLDQVVPSAVVSSSMPAASSPLSPLSPRRLSRAVVVSAIAVLAILVLGSLLVYVLASNHGKSAATYKSTNTALPNSASGQLQLQDVLVNGQLHVNNSLVITPTVEPGSPTVGQLYLSSSTKLLSYYNGSQFIALGSSSNTSLQAGSTSLQGTGARGLQGPAGAGGGTSTDASTLVSGTLSDTRLGPNIALLNRDSQTFHGRHQVFQNTANDTSAFSIQAADGTPELTVDTVNNTVTTSDLLPRVGGSYNPGFVTTSTGITPKHSFGFSNDSTLWSAIGSDSFGRFVYYDNNYTTVQLIRCLNTSCNSSNNTTVATDANTVDYSSIIIGPGGFPRITYISYETPSQLHYVQCLNADCTAKTDNVVATGSFYENAFTLGSDGFGRVIYTDYGASPISNYYIRCLNAACTSATAPLVFASSAENAQSIVMAPNGFPAISYENGVTTNNFTVHFMVCQDANCTTNTDQAISGVGNPYYNKIIYDKNGLPGVIFTMVNSGFTTTTPTYVSCANTSCSSSTLTSLISASSDGQSSISGTLGANGYPIMSYNNPPTLTGELFIACSNETCSSNTQTLVDAAGGYPNSIALGIDGFGRIVDYNSTTKLFDYVQLTTVTGQSVGSTGNNIGSNSSRFGTFYNQSVNTQQLTLQSVINSTTSFQVQNAAGSTVLGADTVHGSVGINGGSTTAGYALNVNGSTNINGTLYVTNIGSNYVGPSYGLTGYWFSNNGGYDGSTPVWNDLNHTSDGNTAMATSFDGLLNYPSMLANHPAALGPDQIGQPFSQELQGINVHWEGWVKADYTGVYTFYSQADDEESVTVNNQQVINNWNCCSLPEASGTISLTAGQWYQISVDYGNHSFDGSIYLKWSEANITKQIVPEDHFVNTDPAGGLPSTTANTIQVVGSTAYQNKLENLDSTGSYLQFNPSYNQNGSVQITTRSASNLGLLIQGSNAQNADLLDFQNSAGTILSSISSSGRLIFTSATGDAGTIINIAGAANGNTTNGGLINITNSGNAPAITTPDAIYVGSISATNGGTFISINGGGIGSSPAVAALNQGNGGTGVVASSINGDAFEAWYAYGGGSQTLLTQINRDGGVHVFPRTASTTGLVIQGASSQTADLLDLQNASSVILAKIDASGNLTVQAAVINITLTVNGHIITGNSSGSTTASAGVNCGAGCTASVVGNDTSGVVTVNTGNGSAAGVQATITFASAYGSAPKVILTPNTVPASSNFPQYYYTSNTTTFSLNSYNPLTASSTYTFSYHIEQ